MRGSAMVSQLIGNDWTEGSTLAISGDLSKAKTVALNLDAILDLQGFKVELRGENIVAQVCED